MKLMERREWAKLAGLIAAFLFVSLAPIGSPAVESAVGEGLRLTRWYAREHVILCLLPALVIAGAIAAFVDKAAVLEYLGPKARKSTAYGVGATAGSMLAVCSCTVLPMFAGIYRVGAGLGPATAFLYAGPAINVLAVILTARVLGVELGLARAVGAVVLAVGIGLLMAAWFERGRPSEPPEREGPAQPEQAARPLGQLAALFGLMVAALVAANWSAAPDATGDPSSSGAGGLWRVLHEGKWWLTGAAALPLAALLWRRFAFPLPGLVGGALLVAALALVPGVHPSIPFAVGVIALCVLMPFAGAPGRAWWSETWSYTKLIVPLLLAGVFVAGLLLGSNLGASVVGALMYFATLTEVPILEGLIGAGMGRGPALALLLAGPALSLPNMLVIRGVLGTAKAAAYVLLVVVGSTLAGLLFGALA